MKIVRIMALSALALIASLSTLQAQTLIVGDQANNELERFDGATGAFQGIFVPSGQSYSAFQPTGLTYGPDGNLYVVGSGLGEVLRYDGATGAPLSSQPQPPFPAPPTALFSVGSAMAGAFDLVFGPDQTGDLYPDIFATNANKVTLINGATGAFVQNYTLLPPVGPNPVSPASFTGIALGGDGKLYISDQNGSPFNPTGNGIVQLDPVTGVFTTFIAGGTAGMSFPQGLTFGPDGNLYVTASSGLPGLSDGVLRFNGTTGAFIDNFVTAGSVSFGKEVLFGPDGNLYVSSYFHSPPTLEDPGVASFVGRYNGTTGAYIDNFAQGSTMDGFYGIAFSNLVAVPETSTVVVSALISLALLCHLWRGRRALSR